MLTVCTWLWGAKYGADYVRKLAAGVARHLRQPHRFVVVSDDFYRSGLDGIEVIPIIRDLDLLKVKGCFARLRMFDPQWQDQIGAGGRLACFDLDAVITGDLDPVFDRAEPFVILQGANASNPCPYNGSLIMLRAGYRPDVWSDFSLKAAAKVPHYEFPDDQAWLAHKLPGAAGWRAGEGGVYAFKKPGWPKGDDLPTDARIVVFPGMRDPSQFTHLDWVQRHWIA